MHTQPAARPRGGAQPAAFPELKVVVMGLHWSPRAPGSAAAGTADLDALCVLLDAENRVLEVVDPQHPRNGNGSVIHTGDSRDGANHWDDERIFVFLEALPETVASLALCVASATGHAFHEVRGAVCHVSDHASEHEWLRLDLTALEGRRRHTVATLRRGAREWAIEAGGADFGD
jgi:stress response protein SCP2